MLQVLYAIRGDKVGKEPPGEERRVLIFSSLDSRSHWFCCPVRFFKFDSLLFMDSYVGAYVSEHASASLIQARLS